MIIEMKYEQLREVNKPNEVFPVIGKIIPQYESGVWSFIELLFDLPYSKSYSDDEDVDEEYVGNPEKVVFLYYCKEICIGHVVLRKNWNQYVLIENISVDQSSRGRGVGSKLIKRAIEWAKMNNLEGLMLETQDTNLLACRFYNKCGFKIGGVDTMLYANTENAHEKAIFWYMKF